MYQVNTVEVLLSWDVLAHFCEEIRKPFLSHQHIKYKSIIRNCLSQGRLHENGKIHIFHLTVLDLRPCESLLTIRLAEHKCQPLFLDEAHS